MATASEEDLRRSRSETDHRQIRRCERKSVGRRPDNLSPWYQTPPTSPLEATAFVDTCNNNNRITTTVIIMMMMMKMMMTMQSQQDILPQPASWFIKNHQALVVLTENAHTAKCQAANLNYESACRLLYAEQSAITIGNRPSTKETHFITFLVIISHPTYELAITQCMYLH